MQALAWSHLFLLGALWSATGCAQFTTIVPEQLRLSQLEDVGAEQLGLDPGVTSLATATQRMRARGLTGVAYDAKVHEGVELSVLGADFQRRLHLFKNDRYWQSVRLPQGAGPSYGLELRFADNEQQLMLLAVQQPPIASAATEDVLTVFEVTPDTVQASWQRPLSDLVEKNGGMSHPRLVAAWWTGCCSWRETQRARYGMKATSSNCRGGEIGR